MHLELVGDAVAVASRQKTLTVVPTKGSVTKRVPYVKNVQAAECHFDASRSHARISAVLHTVMADPNGFVGAGKRPVRTHSQSVLRFIGTSFRTAGSRSSCGSVSSVETCGLSGIVLQILQ